MSDFVPLVRRLHASVLRAPHAQAIVHGGRRVSYADLWAETGAVAGLLLRGGLRRGDRVALVLENSTDYVSAYYGVLAAGGVAVALNTAARERELSAWLAHCGATWIFLDERHPDAVRLLKTLGREVHVVMRGMPAENVTAWPDPTPLESDLAADPNANDLAAIVYTSGTTGRPKGVALTQGNFSANTDSILDYLQLRQTDRVLNVLPFFYSYGGSVLHTHLAAGAALILENSFAYPQRILERMAAERVTGFPGVSSTFALLLQSTDVRKVDISSLRYLTQAGGPMPVSQIRRIRALIPNVELFVMYGQTEATARLTYLPPGHLEEKLGSAGIPIRGVELDVRGDTGESLTHGEPGEVWVRGANVMAGYYRDPAATAAVLCGGWLKTGDSGYVDAEGFLYIQGRRSDMIKSGAHRISPLDVEDVIAALPEVAEVAVVGLPDDVLGETIKAVIALRPGASLDALAVQRHCSEQLPRYKVPKFVEFTDRLPRTTSGKVMRYRLAAGGPDYDNKVRTA
jgi:acyl-CoA synthetase (AMP-forming)/AMP-acid ligase II